MNLFMHNNMDCLFAKLFVFVFGSHTDSLPVVKPFLSLNSSLSLKPLQGKTTFLTLNSSLSLKPLQGKTTLVRSVNLVAVWCFSFPVVSNLRSMSCNKLARHNTADVRSIESLETHDSL